MTRWPFDPILSTVVLSDGEELLSREGYEFGGYFFHPEEMGNLGQFAGSKLKRYGSQPLLGVTHAVHTSTPQIRKRTSQSPVIKPQVAGDSNPQKPKE